MSDPRESLQRTTIQATTQSFREISTFYPRYTQTPLDRPRPVYSEDHGMYYLEDQSPQIEGEVAILFHQDFGERVAEMFVTVDINGTLEWKPVFFFGSTVDTNTGQPWNP